MRGVTFWLLVRLSSRGPNGWLGKVKPAVIAAAELDLLGSNGKDLAKPSAAPQRGDPEFEGAEMRVFLHSVH